MTWSPPTPSSERNYPHNCWWVAGLSSEINRDLLGRWLLDTPVLLYRREDGTAVAIEDRCPHRAAPLSLGCLKGDDVQCGYHGFTFAPDGSCVKVPSLKSPPAAVSVRSFPVIDKWPFVWVYLGDPECMDQVPPPHDLDWASDETFAAEHGRLDVAANYMLLKENVLDLTHFGYVHAATFKITDWVDPPSVTAQDERVSYHQSFRESPLPALFAEPLGLTPGIPFNRENYGSFVSPALQIAAVDLIEPATEEIVGRFRITHATTPIDTTHMHYFWVVARDYGKSGPEMAELKAITEQGFAEDETIIEAIQAVLNRDPRGSSAPETSVKADKAGVIARRLVEAWMERESA